MTGRGILDHGIIAIMQPVISVPRFLCLVTLLGVFLLGSVPRGYGQVPVGEGNGTVTLEDWPESLPDLLDDMGSRAPYLLPRIDSLGLDYRYSATDTTSQWSFVFGWRPDDRVLYEGEVIPWRDRPPEVRMVNVEFRADVRVDGQSVGEMIIGVDSMSLGPLPDRFAFNATVGHDRVFLDASAEEARRILSREATLGRLVVERMGFSSAEDRRETGQRPDARQQEEGPRRPSIYAPRSRIHIGWRIGPRLYYVDEDGGRPDSRTVRPRGATIGRTADAGEGREGSDSGDGEEANRGDSSDETSGRSDGRSSSDDNDDEDDDADLLVPALGAVVAVAAVGYAGGTVGLYGRGDTPLGLAAGRTTPRGGLQLQAAVNRAVVEDGPRQKLTAKAIGFYDVFGARLQPALGLGVQIDPDHQNGDVHPSVSAGFVGNLGRVVLYGGFDVAHNTPEVGLTYNFRYERGGEEADSGTPR